MLRHIHELRQGEGDMGEQQRRRVVGREKTHLFHCAEVTSRRRSRAALSAHTNQTFSRDGYTSRTVYGRIRLRRISAARGICRGVLEEYQHTYMHKNIESNTDLKT
jgi:hypothetical protein